MRAITRETSAIALAVGVAEGAIALVDDDDDRPDGPDDIEDLLQVALGGAHPLRPEVLQLDRGKAAFLRERLGDEGLAGAHRAGEQQAHRHGSSGLGCCRR
jgi:hypothetical protein